jgi:hypothetical protein
MGEKAFDTEAAEAWAINVLSHEISLKIFSINFNRYGIWGILGLGALPLCVLRGKTGFFSLSFQDRCVICE